MTVLLTFRDTWRPPGALFAGAAVRAGALAVCLAAANPSAAGLADTRNPVASEQSGTSPEIAAEAKRHSRFQRTLLAAQAADPGARADFGRVTLVELGAALSAEIDLVEGELERGEEQAKLRGWVGAVRQYLRELEQLLVAIEQGWDVRLALGPAGQPEVWVDHRAVIATHPRPGHQALLEQAILAEFCASRDCASLTASPRGSDGEAASPIPVSRGGVRPTWRFDATGPVCEHRGLSVRFSLSSDLSRNRALCEQFLLESARLLDELAWQRRHDVEIQWQGLAVTAFPGRPGHVVRLNESGDSVLATLPIIHGTEGLLRLLVPWMRAVVEGGDKQPLFLEAQELGWEASTAGQ